MQVHDPLFKLAPIGGSYFSSHFCKNFLPFNDSSSSERIFSEYSMYIEALDSCNVLEFLAYVLEYPGYLITNNTHVFTTIINNKRI
jgi:hypothetical protein